MKPHKKNDEVVAATKVMPQMINAKPEPDPSS